MKRRNHVYIAGKVTGLDYAVAYTHFHYAEEGLKANHKTINPMKLCRQQWGWWRCMAVCLWNLVTKCNRIYIQDNWVSSRGAKIEVFVAILFGKEIMR